MIRQVSIAVLAITSAGTLQAQSRTVLSGPVPTWVSAAPLPTSTAAPPDAAFRFIYSDTQVLIGQTGDSQYTAYRVKLLKPEALAFGNVSLVWNPDYGDATIHALRIWRGGASINVLKTSKFSVLQREGGLEQAALDGLLTAALQTPGLQLGDELEFIATVRRHDPVLGANSFGAAQMPTSDLSGVFRTRLNWASNLALNVRATRDLPPAMPTDAGGLKTVSVELRDPSGSIATDGAPPRYNQRRMIEYTSFASWEAVSRLFHPLYEQAAKIGPASPLAAEIARIKAAGADPAARAMAALRLVQDQVRYVYVGLNGGNYRPASADETWQRRFGDCKAKTALLLGLLRALDIPAEAVTVNATEDDGTDRDLPSPGAFNHILVRAQVGGKSYWLDGTRLGDRYLDRLPAPSFHWALPILASGAKLEAVPVPGPMRPQFVSVVDVDASAGFTASAKVKVTNVLRDDEAFLIKSKLAAMSVQDADRALKSYWREQQDWIEADRVAWRYDERNTTLTMSVEGSGTPDWKGATDDRYLSLWGAGFVPPDTLKRPKEQDQSAPWMTDFPRWKCWSTTLRLPPATAKIGWKMFADPVNQTVGGVRYWRASSLAGGIARTVMSRHVLVPEISASEATQSNAAIATFNNKQSTVEQTTAASAKDDPSAKRSPPFADGADWTGDAPACSPPA